MRKHVPLYVLLLLLHLPVLTHAQYDSATMAQLDTITLKETSLEAARQVNSYIDAGQRQLSMALGEKYLAVFDQVNDVGMVKLLNYMSYTARALRRFDQSKAFLDDAGLRLAAIENPGNMAVTYMIERVQYFRQVSEIDSAVYYIRQAYAQAKALDYHWGVIGAHFNLATIHYYTYDNYDSASIYYIKALQLAEQTNDVGWQLRTCAALAEVYRFTENHEMRVKYLNRSLYLINSEGQKDYLDLIYKGLMEAYQALHRADSANYYARHFINIARSNQDDLFLKKGLMVLAGNCVDRAVYDTALLYYNQAEAAMLRLLATDKSLRFKKNNLNEVYRKKAALFKLTENFELAEFNLRKAAEYIDSTHFTAMEDLNVELAAMASLRGQPQLAYQLMATARQYAEKTRAYEDSLRQVRITENTAELEKQYQTAKKQQQILELENKNQQQAAQNNLLWVFVGVSLVLLAAGVYTYRKVKSKNEQLNLAGRKLKDSNNTKDKLISMVSHDLRRPMDNLGILLQLMDNQDTRTLLEQNPDFIADVKDEFKTVNTMLRDLLFWVLLQRDNMVYKPQQFALQALITEQVNLMKPVLRNKALHVVQHNTDYAIETDRDMLRFVLRNLLSNAVQYTPEKGTITIKTVVEANTFRVIVQDTGLGMDQAKLNGLFQVKLNLQALERSASGAGVGLSLCADIARRMGGKLFANSKVNEGSEFILVLPMNVVTNRNQAYATQAVHQK